VNRRALTVMLVVVSIGVWVWWRWVLSPFAPAPGGATVESEVPTSQLSQDPTRGQANHVAASLPAKSLPDTPRKGSSTPRPGEVTSDYDEAFPEEKARPHIKQLDAVTEQVVLGERAFVEGDLEAAYDHFSRVVENDPDHPKAPFALYRLAWVEHKMGEHDHALEDMTEAVEWASIQNDGSQSSKWLLQQARRDLDTLQEAPEPEDHEPNDL
jgi:tetratricopeptide (TPR) repeat protein